MMAAAVLVIGACGGEDTSDPTEQSLPPATVADVAPQADTDTVPPPEPDVAAGVAPELVGTEWNVVNIGLENTITNVWAGSKITLVVDSATALSGFSGCNDYTATYAVEGEYREEADPFDDSKPKGQIIRISDISATTDLACEDRFAEQEIDYFKDLADSDRWFISDGSLRLVSNDNGIRVEANPN